MSEELKPCPFCGFDTICEENHLVFCLNCGTSNHISEWNTRPVEDALQVRIAELEAENERLQNKLIIVHEKAMEDTSAALFWYAKAKGISLEHTSIENNTIAWMQKRIAEMERNNSGLKDENKELKQRVTEMGQRIAELEARIIELEAELNFLRLSNLDNLTRLEGEG